MTEKRAHAELAAKYFADSELNCWVWVEPVDENGFWEKVDMPKWSPIEIYEVGDFKPTHTPKRKVTLTGLALDTVTIGEREVEGPMRRPPEHGKPYWVLNQLEEKVVQQQWSGSTRCWHNLCRRCAFSSEEAATAFMNAVNEL